MKNSLKNFNPYRSIRIGFLLMGLFVNLSLHAVILNDSMPSGKNYDKALFRLWYPNESKTLKGLIILVPGSNSDGRDLISDTLWQQLAAKHHLGLLACYFTDKPHANMNLEEYFNVSEGSGQALLDVISKFSLQSQHPELIHVPLLLWGHSAGGQFNYEFVCWKPERVLAFVVNKGGFYYTALAPEQSRKVPGIIFIGEKDIEPRNDILKGIFSVNRRVGALWSMALEPEAGHEIGQTLKLAIVFFDELISLRLSNTKDSSMLKSLSFDMGYAGDNKAKTFKRASVEQNEYYISWLPTLRYAEAWVAFSLKKPFF